MCACVCARVTQIRIRINIAESPDLKMISLYKLNLSGLQVSLQVPK